MGRALLFGAVMFAVLLGAATSRSDVAPESEAPVAVDPEPTLEEPVMPAPGSETPSHDPFTPYDIGGAAAIWTYDDLTPDEQAVAAPRRWSIRSP